MLFNNASNDTSYRDLCQQYDCKKGELIIQLIKDNNIVQAIQLFSSCDNNEKDTAFAYAAEHRPGLVEAFEIELQVSLCCGG